MPPSAIGPRFADFAGPKGRHAQISHTAAPGLDGSQ
jgi:hypothetical protein